MPISTSSTSITNTVSTHQSRMSILHLPSQVPKSTTLPEIQNGISGFSSSGNTPPSTLPAAAGLNPGAPSFRMPANDHPIRINQPKTKKTTSKQQKTYSQLEFDLEFKVVELNNAKTLILELETEIKKLKQSNTILESRINLF